MKKTVSILISAVIAFLPFVTVFAAPMQEERESKDLNGFIKGVASLAREYDKGKDFVVPENDETAQIRTFSAENTTDNSEPKYNLQDFQTARLIVRTNGKFNKHGALEDISGFEDFHILQYESPEEAMEVYAELQAEKNITNVAPDMVVYGLQGDTSTILTQEELDNSEYLCDWSHDRTQSDRLLDYLKTKEIPNRKVIVAVIDSGIDYNNEIFEGRVEYSKFNSSIDGKPDDEFDGAEESHGTAVSSVIVDNTPGNVKVSVYKVFNDDLSTTISQIAIGYQAAIESNPDIINASFTHVTDDSGIIKVCLSDAYEKNIPVFAAVGNTGRLDMLQFPANKAESIAVSATDRDNTTTLWNSQTLNSDISAPGQDVLVAISDNKYKLWFGTSFATPCVASMGAILKLYNPDITVDEIDARLKQTSVDVKKYNYNSYNLGDYTNNYHSLWDGVGMVQFCSAFGLPELETPKINLENKLYVGKQICSIQCADENAKILYTTDGTYPALENSTEYKEPFEIIERTRIRAVAYYEDGGYYSREVEVTPRIQYTDSDDTFTITSDGIITEYKGNIANLCVQDTINGITVTGFEQKAFSNATLKDLTLPRTVLSIPIDAFYKNKSLEFIHADGVVEIGEGAFDNSNLIYAEFPNAKVIGEAAFSETQNFCFGDFTSVEVIEPYAFGESSIVYFNGPSVTTMYEGAFSYNRQLEVLRLPKCTELIPTMTSNFHMCSMFAVIDMSSIKDLSYTKFSETKIVNADFPLLEIIDEETFENCQQLEMVNLPKLLSVPKNAFINGYNSNLRPRIYILDSVNTIGENAFGNQYTTRAEFSHLETAQSLPQTEGCIIAMPSTFSECTEDTAGRNYKVYGTSGTYAETWANENGHEFINISQDTAILKDVPMEYTDKTQTLSPDIIGFNRTYQWYASDKPDNTSGTPIEGATDREFNPADYPAAKYYYCVVTSTDVGYDPIEIRTGVTENTTLNPADYSKVEKAKSEIPENLSLYTDESVKALQDILDNIDYSLDETEQSRVDDYAKAIEEAINSLEYKPADYTEYNKAVEKAESLDRSLYKDLTALDNALSVDVKDKNITEQAVVDEQTKAIEEAVNSLEYKPADYTEYNKAVEKANSLDRNLYQDLTALDNALSVDVSGKNITEQAVVDEQTKAIEEAINALEYKPADYSKLNSALAQVPEDLSMYTDESVKRLNSVIENLNYNLNVTQQDEADKQVEALLEAINSLEKRYILGDVNLDGEITILDAKWVLQNIVRLRSLGGLSLKAADMNQDGKITILDARLILFAVTRF